MAGAAAPVRPALTFQALAGALVAIALLAFVLPAVAVTRLHARRLEAVTRDLRAIADGLRSAQAWPADDILAGPGERPHVEDERWNSVAALPLARAATRLDRQIAADPWGNAYLVCQESDGRAVWVLSAGPDGVLQTPFHVPGHEPVTDDQGVRVPIR